MNRVIQSLRIVAGSGVLRCWSADGPVRNNDGGRDKSGASFRGRGAAFVVRNQPLRAAEPASRHMAVAGASDEKLPENNSLSASQLTLVAAPAP